VEALSKDEFLALLATAKASRPRGARDWLMILTHFWHAGRASEIIHLTRDSIQDGFIVFDRLKGSETCEQELVEHANPLLSERLPLIELALNTPPGVPLFRMCRQHYWRLVRKHALAAGIPRHKAKTTVLKHTICTLMIENAPVNKVQRRAGHVSGASTLRYMKAKESDVDRIVVGAVGL
jgi:integrase